MLVDTHAHLNFQVFKDDLDQVLRQSQKAGIEKIINVGADLDSSQKAVEIAQKYSSCYASVGIHPHHAGEQKTGWEQKLKQLAQNRKVVAIGECGLDYHSYETGGITNPQTQKEVFEKQLNLARELNLPIIFHCRHAQEEILHLIKVPVTGVFHCFSGDEKFLGQVLKKGFYVGLDGNLTFKNAKDLQEVAKSAPLQRILLETDSPYLTPEPFRGLRNSPGNVKLIAEFLAQLLDVSFGEVAKVTSDNAQKVFPKTR